MRKPSGIACLFQALLVTLGLSAARGSWAQQPAPAPQPSAASAQAATKPEETKKTEEAKKPEEEKSFDEVVKDMEVIKGLFTFYRKADENKVLMEILPEQLDKTFLFAATIDQAAGERGLYASMMGGDFPFLFRRVGKNILWVEKNTSFTAASQTPAARFTARSFTDAILGSAKIQSKPHPQRKSILIDVSEPFVSDLMGFTIGLNQVYQPTNYKFDKDRSAVGVIKSFPENALLEVELHYTTDNPRVFSITLPDARSIPLVVKYELSTLKDTGYKPRLADDRVGHFTTVQQDFTTDRPMIPYVRYITRWQLEKADPKAKLSPPKQPIVYWLENTIPVEYREWVKEGILLWNKAFERIGFKDAIVVKQQPDNPDWDSDDIRYSMIRWFTGVDAGFAIGPSRVNPFTGQIYDAHIGFSEVLTRYVRRESEELVGPVVQPSQAEVPFWSAAWARNPRYFCDYAQGLMQQAAFTRSVLDARGPVSPEVEAQYMHEFLVSTVAHEVGHTLGLRHNFRASTMLKVEELHDLKKTNEVSQSASVMDYNPMIIAPKGKKQGHFLPVTLGPYDYWAIEYAYKPLEGDEKAELAKIAMREADPLLPYSTDEDTLGTVSPESMDPMDNQFDQSADPIAYFRERLGIVQELWAAEESKLALPGEGYQIMRRAMRRGLNEYGLGLLTVSKYVGGVYHYRDHVGDPNGRIPYVPVPAAKQREALEFLRSYAFSEKAFQLPPGLLNKLAIERLPGLDFVSYYFTQRLDFPWHDTVLALQHEVLDRLYNPIVLSRIQDNELRFAANETPFAMADLFAGLNASIWSELDTGPTAISSLRRNLQREQLKQLIRLTLRTAPPGPPPPPPSGIAAGFPPTPRPPEDATTLARASLLDIQARIQKAIAAGSVTERTTRAHLEETQARIAATLQAQIQKPVE
jgi:hypothetical protein